MSRRGFIQATAALYLQPNWPRPDDVVDMTGRTEIDPNSLPADTIHVVFLGQSRNNNSIDTLYGGGIYPPNIYNMSMAHEGRCFTVREPLLVGDLTSGHHGIDTAVWLLANGGTSNVLLTNGSDGGSFIANWAPGGGAEGTIFGPPLYGGQQPGCLAYRLGLIARCIRKQGLQRLRTVYSIGIGEWSQGTGTTTAQAQDSLTRWLAEMKRCGCLTDPNMTVAFMHQDPSASSAIGVAQAAVCDGSLVRLGYDFGPITTSANTYDGEHFNRTGAAAQGALMGQLIAGWI